MATQETSALLELLPEGDRSQANLREVLASEMQTLWQCPRPLPALNASTFAQLDRELACPLSFLALLISPPSQLSIFLIGVCVALREGQIVRSPQLAQAVGQLDHVLQSGQVSRAAPCRVR